MAIIYCIKGITNNYIYIGKSIQSINSRKSKHVYDSKKEHRIKPVHKIILANGGFCNFDYGGSGFCEPCSGCPDCFQCGLPEEGAQGIEAAMTTNISHLKTLLQTGGCRRMTRKTCQKVVN